jgi:GT2 family glycosyltransferase
MYPLTYILILNWNGWRDTIECLESVLRINYPNYRVIVCDNKSTDNSYDNIKGWAHGYLSVHTTESNPLRGLSFPPIPKPVPYEEYDHLLAEKGGKPQESEKLILIQNGDNLGFAGGNNVGLRYAMARADFEYIWLLNNRAYRRAALPPVRETHLLANGVADCGRRDGTAGRLAASGAGSDDPGAQGRIQVRHRGYPQGRPGARARGRCCV